jgi:Domain of unknown function (DUF6268)
MFSLVSRFGLFFGGSALVALAQPASSTFRSSLLQSWSLGYSYSSQSDLTRDGPAGAVAVNRMDFSFSGRWPISPENLMVYGCVVATNEFDPTPGTPLPERLSEVSLNLGLIKRYSPQWSVSLFARPGFYGDFTDLGDSLNIPVLFLANYTQRKELVWSFGLNINPLSEYPILPVAGVRWQFAPAWTFNLGFPQAGLVYQQNPKAIWRAGVSFQGGSFRISENLGVPAPGVDRLANTRLDYRETRFGVGADLTLPAGFVLALDAGLVGDRKFDYYDRDYILNGDPAVYGSIALRAAF